jgi:hypothetical protein
MDKFSLLIMTVYGVGLLIAVLAGVFTEYIYSKAKKEDAVRDVGQPAILSIARTLYLSTNLFIFIYLIAPFIVYAALK